MDENALIKYYEQARHQFGLKQGIVLVLHFSSVVTPFDPRSIFPRCIPTASSGYKYAVAESETTTIIALYNTTVI